MPWYRIALLAHVLGSFGICAALAIEIPILFRLRQTKIDEQARGLLSVFAALKWLGSGSVVALLGGGFYMAAIAWHQAPWVTVAFASVILFGLVGGLATGRPISRVRKALTDHGDAVSQEALKTIRQPMLVVSLLVRISIVLSAAVLMVFKPNLENSALIALVTIIVGAITGTVIAQKGAVERQIIDVVSSV